MIYDDWKLIRFYNDTSGGFELFDLAADPYEQRNLLAEAPERFHLLKARLEAWQTNAQVRFARKNDDFVDGIKPSKDRLFTRKLATKERTRDEAKRAAAQSKKE